MRMNREEEIQVVKQNIKIEDLADYFGLKVKTKRNNRIAYYSPVQPNYELVVYRKSNYFIDYGAGGKKGSVIDFYIYMTGKTYIETIRELRGIIFDNNKPAKAVNIVKNYTITAQKLNDFRLVKNEFEELLRLYISKTKEKTKYLKQLRRFIKEMKENIVKDDFKLEI